MYKFDGGKPRSLETFGVAGLLEEKCQVFYNNLSSPKLIGRVTDLITARLHKSGMDDFALRELIMMSMYESYRSQVSAGGAWSKRSSDTQLEEPVVIEVGVDSQKIAIGVSFKYHDNKTVNIVGLAERLEKNQPANQFEKILNELRTRSDQAVIRVFPGGKQIEIVTVLGLPEAELEDASHAVEFIKFDKIPGQAPSASVYTELGDTNYAELLQESGKGMKKSASMGETLAKHAKEMEREAARIERGADEESESRSFAGRGEEKAGKKKVEGYDESDSGSSGVEDMAAGDSETRVKGRLEKDGKRGVKGKREDINDKNKVTGKIDVGDDSETVISGDKQVDENGNVIVIVDDEDRTMNRLSGGPKKKKKKKGLLGGFFGGEDEGEEGDESREGGAIGKVGKISSSTSSVASRNTAELEKILEERENALRVASTRAEGLQKKIKILQDELNISSRVSQASKDGDVDLDDFEFKRIVQEAAQEAGTGKSGGKKKARDDDEEEEEEEEEAPNKKSGIRSRFGKFFGKGAAAEEDEEDYEDEEGDEEEDGPGASKSSRKSKRKKGKSKESSAANGGDEEECEEDDASEEEGIDPEVAAAKEPEAALESLEESGEAMDSLLGEAEAEVEEMMSLISDKRAKNWINNLIKDMQRERLKMNEQMKYVNASIKKKELEHKTAIRGVEEELKRRSEAYRQKDNSLMRTKDHLSRMNENFERLKTQAIQASNDAQYKKRYEHVQQMYGTLKSENHDLLLKVQEGRRQLSQAEAMKGGLDPRQSEAIKAELGRTRKVADDLKRQNQQMMERLSVAERSLGAQRSRLDEATRRLEHSSKQTALSKRKLDMVKVRAKKVEMDKMKLTREVQRLRQEIRSAQLRAKANQGGQKTGAPRTAKEQIEQKKRAIELQRAKQKQAQDEARRVAAQGGDDRLPDDSSDAPISLQNQKKKPPDSGGGSGTFGPSDSGNAA